MNLEQEADAYIAARDAWNERAMDFNRFKHTLDTETRRQENAYLGRESDRIDRWGADLLARAEAEAAREQAQAQASTSPARTVPREPVTPMSVRAQVFCWGVGLSLLGGFLGAVGILGPVGALCIMAGSVTLLIWIASFFFGWFKPVSKVAAAEQGGMYELGAEARAALQAEQMAREQARADAEQAQLLRDQAERHQAELRAEARARREQAPTDEWED